MIQWIYQDKTDHSLVILKFDFSKFEKGRSYWIFNNSLLKDTKYIDEVKKIILQTKRLYASEIQTQNLDINDIHPRDLDLSIDEQLLF